MKIIRNRFLLLAIFLLAAASASVAQSGEVLVGGQPPLTRGDVESIITYYERALMLDFSAGQLAELEEKLVNRWARVQRTDPRSLSQFLKTVRTINSWDHDKLERLRGELSEAVLADLKSGSANDFNRLVLDIDHERGREEFGSEAEVKAEADKRQEESPSVETSVKLSDLVGTWHKASVSSHGYRNTVTNDYRSAHGSANMHEIRANGAFDYTNFAQISSYGCTTELNTSMKGRVSVSGSKVTFTYVSGTVKGKDSCKSTGFTRPAQIKTTVYRAERKDGKLMLCETGTELTYCLVRED